MSSVGTPVQDPDGGVATSASAISSNGTWVAGSHRAGGPHAVVWNLDDGTIRDYASDSGAPGFSDGFVAVNNSGDAIDVHSNEGNDSELVRADDTRIDLVGVASTVLSRDADMDAAGWTYHGVDDYLPRVWRDC